MATPSKVVVLFDATSAANTAISSGLLDTSDFDCVTAVAKFSAAAAGAPTLRITEGLASTSIMAKSVGATATEALVTVGAGGGGAADSASYALTSAVCVPGSLIALCTAAGAAVTTRLIVYGRRNHRGPDVSSNPD